MEYKDIKYLGECIKPLLPICLDNCFTEAEQIAKLTCGINELIANDNYFKETLDTFLSQFDGKLNDVVESILNQWNESGKLEEIFEKLIPDTVYVANPEMIPSTAGLILSFYGPDRRDGMLYKTLDGLHFTPIFKMPDDISWTNTCLWYKDDYWYAGIFSNAPDPDPGNNLLSFLVSKDLYKWETINVPYTPAEIEVGSNPGNFFVYNKELYYCFYGYTSSNVRKNYLCKIALDQNNIKINDLKEITGFPSTDYFDPFIYCDGPNNLIFVKEDNDTGKIWKYSINIEDGTVSNPQMEGQFNKGDVGQCEAPSYNVDDYGNTYLYADDYRSGFVTHPYGGMVVSVNGEAPVDINAYSRPMRAGIFLKLRNCPQALVAINQFLPVTIAPIQVGTSENAIMNGETLNAYTGDDNVYLSNNNPTISTIANKPGPVKIIVPRWNQVTFTNSGNIMLPAQQSSVAFLAKDSEKMVTLHPLPDKSTYYLENTPTVQYPGAIFPNRKVLYIGAYLLNGYGANDPNNNIYDLSKYLFGTSEVKIQASSSFLTDGNTYLDAFNQWKSTKNNVDLYSFTDVFIIASYLDARFLYSDTSNNDKMITAINNTVSAIHTSMPNCIVHIFNANTMFESDGKNDFYSSCLLHRILQKAAENSPNLVYHGWIGWSITLDKSQQTGTADIHYPNDSGYYRLANALVNAYYGSYTYGVKSFSVSSISSKCNVTSINCLVNESTISLSSDIILNNTVDAEETLFKAPRVNTERFLSNGGDPSYALKYDYDGNVRLISSAVAGKKICIQATFPIVSL